MQMKAYMKRTGSYMATTRLTVTVICLLLLLVVSPLYGRRYDMAIVPDTDVDLSSEVGAVLRDAGGSVNINYAPSYFTADARINKFSKRKPVRYRKDFGMSDSDFNDARYGIYVVKVDTYNIGGDISWGYNIPRGGVAEPYRLEDFRGYNSAAISPVRTGFPTELSIDEPDRYNYVTLDIDDDFDLPEGNIRAKDVHSDELSWYPGIMALNRTRNQSAYRTSATTLQYFSSDTLSVPLLQSWKEGDTIDMYTILSPNMYTGGNESAPPPSGAEYYLAPDSNSGYGRAALKSTYNPTLQYELVGYPKVLYTETVNYDEPAWLVYDVSGYIKNNGNVTHNVEITAYIENYSEGDSDYFGPVTTGAQPGETKSFGMSGSFYSPRMEYTQFLFISLTIVVNGKAGVLFSRYQNMDTGEWVDNP